MIFFLRISSKRKLIVSCLDRFDNLAHGVVASNNNHDLKKIEYDNAKIVFAGACSTMLRVTDRSGARSSSQ